MADTSAIKEHMEVIGADGAHVGTVDAVEGDRIKLIKADSGLGSHQGHHHYLSTGLVAEVEGDKVRLSATAANALMFKEEEQTGASVSAPDRAVPVPPVATVTEASPPPASEKSIWSWNRIGLGAAVIGAAAGAALLTRKGGGEEADDFELRLQTDENVRLISSTKVEGTPVVGRNGDKLGTIQSFMVDKYTGRVAYAVMAFGGTMGLGGSLFPLPWPLLDYDVARDGYVLDITKEQLAEAPKFQPSEAPEFDAPYRRRVMLFYRPA